MSQTMSMPAVLTLEEVADYLRLPKETVEQEATFGHIPGRKIEDTWRFLKIAVDDWLRQHDSRTILLQQAGALSEDDMLTEFLAEIYDARGRSEVSE
jgi:excisionase family DNA binding protein